MTVTLLSVLIAIIFITITCIKLHDGASRGFLLAAVMLGVDITALFPSFFAARWVASLPTSHIVSFLETLAAYRRYTALLPSLRSVVSAVLTMLCGSLLFIFIYLLLRQALKTLVLSVCEKYTVRPKNDPGYAPRGKNRSGGAFCGFLSAVVLTVSVTAPVMGTLELADRSLHIVKQTSTDAYNALGPGNAAMVRSFTKDVGGNLFYRIGGKAVYNAAASTAVSDRRVFLLAELGTVSQMSEDMLTVYRIFENPGEATEEHVRALRRLGEDVGELVLCERLSAEIVKACAEAWRDGEAFLSITRPEVGGALCTVLDEVLAVCENANVNNAAENAGTLFEVYAIILESGIFGVSEGDHAAMIALLEETDTVGRIDLVLGENPDMAHISAASVAMTVFSAHLEETVSPEQTEALYEALAVLLGRANRENGAAYTKAAAIASEMRYLLIENGVDVSLAFTRDVAEQLLRDLPGKNVSASDVGRLIGQYRLRMNGS